MSFRGLPAAAGRAARLLPVPGGGPAEAQIRQAAWVARCVGRGQSAPRQKATCPAITLAAGLGYG